MSPKLEKLDRLSACSWCLEPVRWAKVLPDKRILCRACEVCFFFENYLTLTEDYSGQPFRLFDWDRRFLRTLFGTLDEATGLRQYEAAYLEIPKKNKKTTLCAGIGLFCLTTATVSDFRVFGAASAEEQGLLMFECAKSMVHQSPKLSQKFRVIGSRYRILHREDPSVYYQVLSGDGDSNDGKNPSVVVRDELHRWRTKKQIELYNVLERGMVARENGLLIDITTAGEGEDEAPLCWKRHQYAQLVIEDPGINRKFLGLIYSAKLEGKPDDYWTTREARAEANPSHEDNGGYLKDAKLEPLCKQAQVDPSQYADYLRYHLNVWGIRDKRAIDYNKWTRCGGGVDLRDWPEYDLQLLVSKWGLIDRPCVVGVDASQTTDLTAVTAIFPFDNEPWKILTWPFMPEGQVAERERKDKVKYSEWIRRKFLTATEGNSIDLRHVKDVIRLCAEMFELRALAFDPYNFKEAAASLGDEGINCIEVRQGYASLSEPTKWLLSKYLDQQVHHGNHPVMNWNAQCLDTKSDGKDNIQPSKPDRSKHTKRIDCVAAAVTALAVAIKLPKPKKSELIFL